MTTVIRTLFIVCALALFSPAQAGDEPNASADAKRVAAARAAVKELAGGLKKHLKAALKSGGPLEAVSVCQTIAPDLTQSQSERGPMKIRRTAIKLRNPQNAPDAFERRVLALFSQSLENGAQAATLEHAEVVATDGKKLFRYMKAIPMGEKPCMTCHGTNIDPKLQTHITELYPEDNATGFKPGELRGAFSVTQPMN